MYTFHWQADTASGKSVKGDTSFEQGPVHITADLSNEIIRFVEGTLSLSVKEDEKIFMNGYQTWTCSPEYGVKDRIRGMHGIPKNLINTYAFDRYGDYHFVNYPYKKGITHGFSWCYFRKGEFYRLFASLDERPGYTQFQYDANQQILTIKRDCEGVRAEGNYPLFDLFYMEGSEEKVFGAWFEAMHIKPRTHQKLFGYSSWYNRYQNIDEEAISQDLSGCKSLFQAGDLFQIDDGWEPYVGDWLEADSKKFPHGMKKAADDIHTAGFKAGLWLAPFCAEEKSSLYQNHQDWFLKIEGDNWKNGSNWSGFYSLDIDNPEVQNYLKKVFHQVLDEWGYDLVKLDFLYCAAPFGNVKESRAGRMIRAMEFLRQLCGDKLILGCGVPVMPAFGIVDYCRIGCDVSLDYDDKFYMHFFHRERVSTKNAVVNIMTRRELNNRAYMSDPDVFFLRKDNIHLSKKQKHDLAVLDALLGGVFLISDDPSAYTDEMRNEYITYRYIAENAKNIHAHYDHGIVIDYSIDGQEKEVNLF